VDPGPGLVGTVAGSAAGGDRLQHLVPRDARFQRTALVSPAVSSRYGLRAVMNNTCRICGKTGAHATWELREKMFGLGDAFTYFQCLGCGCLQIVSSPKDWARYYPSTYYSLRPNPVPQRGLRSLLAGWRDRGFATG